MQVSELRSGALSTTQSRCPSCQSVTVVLPFLLFGLLHGVVRFRVFSLQTHVALRHHVLANLPVKVGACGHLLQGTINFTVSRELRLQPCQFGVATWMRLIVDRGRSSTARSFERAAFAVNLNVGAFAVPLKLKKKKVDTGDCCTPLWWCLAETGSVLANLAPATAWVSQAHHLRTLAIESLYPIVLPEHGVSYP